MQRRARNTSLLQPQTAGSWAGIATLSLLSLVLGFCSMILLTFSVAGSSVPKTAYASACGMFIMFMAANLAIVVVYGLRKQTVTPLVVAILQALLAVLLYGNITSGVSFSLYGNNNFAAVLWLLGAAVVAAVFVTVCTWRLFATQKVPRSRLVAATGLFTVLFILALLVCMPVDLAAQKAYESYQKDTAAARQNSKDENAEYDALQKRKSDATKPLYGAATGVVHDLSERTLQEGAMPATVTPPSGYELKEYTVDEAARRVRFCIHPTGLEYYLGVIVDPTVKDGAMYWMSAPGDHCYYDYANYQQL